MVRSSLQRLGRLKAARSRPSSHRCLCTLPWTSGVRKWCNHPVGVMHCCAERRRTGCVPSACRRTRNGFVGCCPKGWGHSTSRWRRRRPLCDDAAVFTQARSGASPFWDVRSAGGQSGTARKKLQAACQRLTEWMKQHRHLPGRAFFQRLHARRRGHDNSDGVRGNSCSRNRFFPWAMDWTFTWLNRRGGKQRRDPWEQCTHVLDRVKRVRPRLTEVPRRSVLA
jgi:hypothetical protein